ncbi:general substrate transporter [Hypoxylon trugodes]|uniref:general substrate transporter n=1 Tax=Hypoxylon trugodes TaxID=326681 RepID=UPI00219871EC|nr:general substrate transporter [Hypoxylon trugodes]KAI1391878.1 general substrate transporter [Hypoxylon trugodes]
MPNPPPEPGADETETPKPWVSQKTAIVVFSSLAIALYGYDQGMMSMVNTNYSYLSTMGIEDTSILLGVIVAIYYIGCTFGAIVASHFADSRGRKWAVVMCLFASIFGNLLMFIPGIYPIKEDDTWKGWSLRLMLIGRFVLGLGVGGIDAVIPVYSSELSKDGARGSALAKEFQANIFGLLLAFALNLFLTIGLGKNNQWAWRIPIIFMQIFPWLLLSIVRSLPESPRWLISHERLDGALDALTGLHGQDQAEEMFEQLHRANEEEEQDKLGYYEMFFGSQSHPTAITVMGQINQALTGYGAVSVYGPQIFELLGLKVRIAEYATLGNYIFYTGMMTVAWKTIDVVGRRKLMLWGSLGLAVCFGLLTILGGISVDIFRKPQLPVEIIGSIILCVSTAIFGVSWLTTVWLIPTEIYPNSARAQGSSISVIIWGLANFAITFLTPIGFNNLKYWLFLVFAVTNTIAGLLTWRYSPETGGRSFEENQQFFISAREKGRFAVKNVDGGKYLRMPQREDTPQNLEEGDQDEGEDAEGENAKGENTRSALNERTPLLLSWW